MNPTDRSEPPARLISLDAYRGFVMFLMMGEVFCFTCVANALPPGGLWSGFWKFLSHHQTHVEWVGCSLHDLIQPSFSFLVGVALPYSIASRMARGQKPARMIAHAAWRALVLILLGVFLRSVGAAQLNWTFEDTLSQIGLGYGLLFALGFRPLRDQWLALAVLLGGYWLAFALYPLPSANFDYAQVGVTKTWLEQYGVPGFTAHWQKNSNLAWAFDRWWLNLFPRPSQFGFNDGGYATLSFIPTLGTMLLGLIAGGVLRSDRSPWAKVKWLAFAGAIGLIAGWTCGALGICPVVKRIWTPSWTLFSGGWCCLLLAGFYAMVDIIGLRRAAFPLTVIGMNSIAAYCIAHLFQWWILKHLKTVLGQNFFKFAGATYEPFFHGATTMLIFWLILYWMQRRKLFLRI